MEQPQYNMFTRERFEKEYAPCTASLGYGTTIWSPLASGLLTGKYNHGIPRAAAPMKATSGCAGTITPEKIDKVKQLQPIADELGCTLAQLGLAWCLTNRTSAP